jgi:hypothetical protein
MRKRHLFVRDHGGDAANTNGIGKVVNRKSCTSMRCEKCAHMQFVTTGQLSRASNIRCDLCGGYLIDTIASETKKGKPLARYMKSESERVVCSCGTKLNSRNTTGICSICDQKKLQEKFGIKIR